MKPDASDPQGDAPQTSPGRRSRYINRLIANEISALTRYYDSLLQWLPRQEDTGLLLALVDAPQKKLIQNGESLPDLTGEEDRRTAVLLNGTLNHHFDIQAIFLDLQAHLSDTSRVVVVLYNTTLGGANGSFADSLGEHVAARLSGKPAIALRE